MGQSYVFDWAIIVPLPRSRERAAPAKSERGGARLDSSVNKQAGARTVRHLQKFKRKGLDFLRSAAMSGKTDELKGRAKEAAGAITDNNKLRREGKVDQAKGKVKQAVDRAADRAKDAVDRATGNK
jgi:uncharacterized protein YjbJ (UPF0337 family)